MRKIYLFLALLLAFASGTQEKAAAALKINDQFDVTFSSITPSQTMRFKITAIDGTNLTVSLLSNETVSATTPSTTVPYIPNSVFQKTLDNVAYQCTTTGIEASAFIDNKNITQVTIPSNITSIGASAFSGCTSLTSLTFSSRTGDLSFGNQVLYGCSGLTSISFPSVNITMGTNVCQNCTKLKSVEFGGLTAISNSMFSNCPQYTPVTIPSTINSIGANAFEGYNANARLEPLEGERTITFATRTTNLTIGKYAFMYSGFTTISLPTQIGANGIGEGAFDGCPNLTAIEIGTNSYYSTDNGVLYDAGKTTLIQYPGGKTETTFNIPSTVTSVGVYSFDYCDKLTSVIIRNTSTSPLTATNTYAFTNTNSNLKCFVPAAVYTAYSKVSPWTSNTSMLKHYLNSPTWTVATDGNYYRTFSADFKAVVPENATAYTATVGKSSVSLTQVATAGQVLPATSYGYLIKKTNNSETDFMETANDETAVTVSTSGNLAPTNATAVTVTANSTMTLGTGQISGHLGFYTFTGTSIGAYKAYISSIPANSKMLEIMFDEGTTDGIQTVGTKAIDSDVYYDLQGRPVSQPEKGLYIKGGKLIVK